MALNTRRARMIAQQIHTAAHTPATGNGSQFQVATHSNSSVPRGTSRTTGNSGTSANPPRRKCTISSIDSPVPTETAVPATSNTPATIMGPPASVGSAASASVSTKRSHYTGPARVRPMQLELATDELATDGSGEELEGVTDGHAAPVHKCTGLQRTYSFYPGRVADVRPAPESESNIDPASFFTGDNSDAESEADWIDEQHLTSLAEKQPSRFEEAIKMERASWDISGSQSAVTSSSAQSEIVLRRPGSRSRAKAKL